MTGGRRSWRRLLGASAGMLFVTAVHPSPAAGHDVTITSMARVFIDQVGERRYVLSAIDTGLAPLGDASVLDILPTHCSPVDVPGQDPSPQAPPTLAFECSEALGPGDVILLPWDLTGIVVVFLSIDRVDSSAFFEGRGRTVPVHFGDLSLGSMSRLRIVTRYTIIGAEHILFGIVTATAHRSGNL